MRITPCSFYFTSFLNIRDLYLESIVCNISPKTPQERNCPIARPSINIGSGASIPYAYFKRKGIMIVFTMIGGSGAKSGLLFRNLYVRKAAVKLARLPNIMSGRMTPGDKALPSKQPTNNPGIAAGVNTGRMVKASEMRTCASPKLMGANTMVSTT